MELKDFVSQALTQIIDGVKESQSGTKDGDAEINPHLNLSHSEMGKQGILWAASEGAAQIVKFDVALTVTEGTGTKGGV